MLASAEVKVAYLRSFQALLRVNIVNSGRAWSLFSHEHNVIVQNFHNKRILGLHDSHTPLARYMQYVACYKFAILSPSIPMCY